MIEANDRPGPHAHDCRQAKETSRVRPRHGIRTLAGTMLLALTTTSFAEDKTAFELKGQVVPSSCELTGSLAFDFGTIFWESLPFEGPETIFRGETPVVIACSRPTLFSLSARDERSDDTNDSSVLWPNFSLGPGVSVTSGMKIELNTGTSDGEELQFFRSLDGGKAWEGPFVAASLGKNPLRHIGFRRTSMGDGSPEALTNVNLVMRVWGFVWVFPRPSDDQVVDASVAVQLNYL